MATSLVRGRNDDSVIWIGLAEVCWGWAEYRCFLSTASGFLGTFATALAKMHMLHSTIKCSIWEDRQAARMRYWEQGFSQTHLMF